MAHTGMGAAYRDATGSSLYTVEAHVRYLGEVAMGAELQVRTRVLARDAKRLRLWHELHVGDRLAATEELMCLHVGPDGTLPFPDGVAAALDALIELDVDAPEHAGRSISPLGRGRTVVPRPAT
jgi:acyl-CoA thioester hydrolase